jgi:mono/diheme cytochrome c family protein
VTRPALAALWAAASAGLVACAAPAATGGEPRAPAAAPATVAAAATLSEDDRARAVRLSARCEGCHGADLLAQQRLTERQWRATVDKMRRWGASLSEGEAELLARFLALTAAGPEPSPRITAAEATAALAPQPDGPYAAGSVEEGARIFTERCADCHGDDARGGGPGVNLVDRPILHQAAAFADVVRRGRGRIMRGAPGTSDRELASLLAWLRARPAR